MLLWGILSLLRTGHHFPGGDRVVSPGDPVRLPKPALWSCLITTGNAGSVALNQAQTSPTNSIIWGRLGGVPQLPCGTSHTPSQAAQEDMRPEKKGCFHPYLGIPATKRETKPRTWLKLCSQRRNHLIYTKFSLKVGLEEVCPAMGSNFTALSRGKQRS